MILVDTSVWIDHLRKADTRLVRLLLDGQVICHSFVIGELACGSLKRRTEILTLLGQLPRVAAVSDEDVLAFVDLHMLMGRGLGWVDAHLLASAHGSGHSLWTRDRRLAQAAHRLGSAA